jgi:hypothetical protein
MHTLDLLDYLFARTTVFIANSIPFRKKALTMGEVMGYRAYDRVRGHARPRKAFGRRDVKKRR